MTLSVNWDLDSIFEGGSQSNALETYLKNLIHDLNRYTAAGLPDPLSNETEPAWVESIQTLYELSGRLIQARSFAECLVSKT